MLEKAIKLLFSYQKKFSNHFSNFCYRYVCNPYIKIFGKHDTRNCRYYLSLCQWALIIFICITIILQMIMN